MHPRRLILSLVVLSLGLATGPARADEPWTVTLADGTQHQGTLVRLAAARYILQTETALYDLTDDDLDPRTFASRSRQETVPTRKIHDIRHYDELHVDGTTTHWWSRLHVNDSRRAITEYRFGYAPWEQLVADQRTYRDGFGNPLIPIYDPPRERWSSPPDKRVQVTLSLPAPVAPGEEWTITGSETSTGATLRDGQFTYRNPGDYAEDNLVWRKVRLPQGATIVSVSPQPTARFQQDGFEYITWRRFYRQGEVYPLEIVYRLD